MINIALYQPEIPQNTAAIIRTCSCFGLKLEIIKPTGFIINEKKLTRIYMDYLKNCEIIYHESFDHFLNSKNKMRIILLTTKSKTPYYNFKFNENDTLLFGSESKGVALNVHQILKLKLNIPISDNSRSLNIATSVAIASSEALRQINLNN